MMSSRSNSMGGVSLTSGILVLLVLMGFCQPACQAFPMQHGSLFRTYFQCPPCDQASCPVPEGCPGPLVKEPGVCGCCLKCARVEGQACGVYMERCAPGLECMPFSSGHSESAELEALFRGKAICMSAGRGQSKPRKFPVFKRTMSGFPPALH